MDRNLINDNYCDCGVDEPGTSACSGFEPQSTFFCKNEGAQEKLIRASIVGDEICDCCDGSDEEEGKCSNSCEVEGVAYRQRLEEEKLMLTQAKARQEELNARLAADRTQWEAELAAKKLEIDPLKATADTCSEQVRQLEETVNAARETRKQKEEAEKATNAETVEETTTEAPKVEETTDKATEGNSEPLPEVHSEYAKWADTDAEHFHKSKEEENPSTEEPDDEYSSEIKEEETVAKVEDPDEKALTNAKSEHRAAQRAHSDKETEIQDLEKRIKHADEMGDYACLISKCFTATTDGFKYEVCFFDKAKQDATEIGTWDKFEKYLTGTDAHFSNGRECPGGRHRSLVLHFECGATEELLEVVEPSTCKYVGKMRHPVACFESRPEI